MSQQTLICHCSNFWPLKTCLWHSPSLTRLIWPLVISSCLCDSYQSYEGVLSRFCSNSWTTTDSPQAIPRSQFQ
jgi:hypothetical protein